MSVGFAGPASHSIGRLNWKFLSNFVDQIDSRFIVSCIASARLWAICRIGRSSQSTLNPDLALELICASLTLVWINLLATKLAQGSEQPGSFSSKSGGFPNSAGGGAGAVSRLKDLTPSR